MPDKYVENVVERLKRTREASLFFYRKIHRLRRLVAGDATALDSAGQNDTTRVLGTRAKRSSFSIRCALCQYEYTMNPS